MPESRARMRSVGLSTRGRTNSQCWDLGQVSRAKKTREQVRESAQHLLFFLSLTGDKYTGKFTAPKIVASFKSHSSRTGVQFNSYADTVVTKRTNDTLNIGQGRGVSSDECERRNKNSANSTVKVLREKNNDRCEELI